ncbi:MAG: DNA repair and recombination protein RadA [Candidatus Heimdallarchaeota archaeon]|nr:DNA repair and recombination protein RadA [Candidatus Heimdallarchaeota archaeon]MCK5299503.1 DNA repair and recombination protein RadA [Candidatus Heimdallarchaeota archaeon]
MFQKKLEELQSVTKELLDKLESKGFSTIESISWLNPEELSEKIGIDLEIAQTIITEAISNIDQKPISAADLLLKEEKRLKISTGSTELDKLLGGGIFTGEITEVSGEFASGKTQLCFQLCINVQLPLEQGGLEGGVYYIDTEGTFSSTRIVQMAQSNGLDLKKLLSNIAVTRTYNSDHLTFLISNVEQIIKERNIKLFIIDSIASHFRAEYVGDDRLVSRQQAIMRLAETMKQLLEKFEIAIVVTNQVIATMDDSLFDKSPHPALGFAWAHRPHQRILLRKGRDQARIARMYDSSRLPDRECVFFVTEKGISDKAKK